jgi:hypothetical protein
MEEKEKSQESALRSPAASCSSSIGELQRRLQEMDVIQREASPESAGHYRQSTVRQM